MCDRHFGLPSCGVDRVNVLNVEANMITSLEGMSLKMQFPIWTGS
jgi:hypothetical protein